MKVLRALLLPALALLVGASSVPLQLPPVIHFAQDTETARTSQALAAALASKHWAIESDTGASITARLDGHGLLRLRIDYTPREISFHYVASDGLGARENPGAIEIHPRVNKWLRRLENAIRIQLQGLKIELPPTEVVPLAPDAEEPENP